VAARIALIRAATIDDAAEIARLSAQLGYPADVATFAERLDRLSRSPTHAVLVCEGGGGRLAGFVGVERRLMIESGDKVEIVGLVVDADARRAGTGRRLVAAAEDWARAQGIVELFLRSNVLRPEAHAFYPALGFERGKTQHVYRKALA
jgi:N-acetylglutamate synthase-like GNAT family acetyltransferase